MTKDTIPTVREELIRKTVEFMIAASEKPGCADPVIAAPQACVAGCLYAHHQRFVNPTPFGLHIGIE